MTVGKVALCFRPIWIGVCFAAALWSVAAAPSASADVLFVDANLTTGDADGSSWADAFQGASGLSAALAAAAPGDQVWVARGVYKPTASTSRTVSFALRNGIELFGGFLPGQGAASDRRWVTNASFLSGDLLDNDAAQVYSDNSHHVVVAAGVDAAAVLDGFIIVSGNANGPSTGEFDRGGGMAIVDGAVPTIRNCIVRNNRALLGGGGIYIRAASPTFTNCRFQTNAGGAVGGGVNVFQSGSVSFERCSFFGNTASRGGAAEVFGQCIVSFNNVLIRGNTATTSSGGGAMFIGSGADANLRSSTIAANAAALNVGGILTSSANTRLFNCIVYDNTGPGSQLSGAVTTASYCLVQGGFNGAGNLDADPMFIDAAADNFMLAPGSPCIDRGDNGAVPPGTVLDLSDEPRFVDDPATPDGGAGTAPIVDLGACEFQPPPCRADLDGDGAVTSQDFFEFLAGFFAGSADFNGDGMVNSQDFFEFLAAFFAGCP